jgi:hypothetical protein
MSKPLVKDKQNVRISPDVAASYESYRAKSQYLPRIYYLSERYETDLHS